ncbi:MAG: hypothetical protein K0S39_5841 [Paenibacillus sp.]|jgi:hypothetical protein|nr:hypothetical protein [Paenibacillus sp.]
MKNVAVIVIALIGGFIGGIVIAEIIGITGNLLFDQPVWLRGVRYLPFIMPFVCVAAVLMWKPRQKK